MNKTDPIWMRIQIKKILWITATWMLLSLGQFLFEYATFLQTGCAPEDFDAGKWLLISLGTSSFAGLLGGTITVLLFEKWYRSMPFYRAFALVLFSFTTVFIVVSLLGFILQNDLDLKKALFEWTNHFFLSVEFIKNFGFWFLVLNLTTAVLQINYKYGPGVLKKVLLGKYFNPQREERIFMFLDLRNSTAIAERLSEVEYFNLLKEIIEDITQPILYTRGEIYQYVGDEVVISWSVKNGKSKANCIRCYFEIQDVIRRKKGVFQQKYGVSIEFKAGLHYGFVLAGEIGVVKRDITYTGNVLNTTSRIQNKCNELGVDVLLSKQLLDKLGLAPHQYQPKRMGVISLRGKSHSEILYTI